MVKMVKKAFGTHLIAGICQVTRQTVARWIEEGKLPSYKTAGGQRRVWAEDLSCFLMAHNIPVPPDVLAATEKVKILIVDDEIQVRRLVSRIVAKKYPKAEIHEAKDGFDAGLKTARLMPQLVILDLRLPGLNGFEVCRVIREQQGLRRTRILAMSGQAAEGISRKIIEQGADDFIAKPFETAEMEKRLEKLLSVKGV